MRITLKSNGHAKEYWNGEKYVEFQNGEYQTTCPIEAAFLLGCSGVSEVGRVTPAMPDRVIDAPPPAPVEDKPSFAVSLGFEPKGKKGKKGKVNDDNIPDALQ